MLFSVVSSGRTRGNKHKVNTGGSLWISGDTFYCEDERAQAWVGLSIYEAPIPGDTQKTSGHGQSAVPEPGGMGKTNLQRPLQTPVILQFPKLLSGAGVHHNPFFLQITTLSQGAALHYTTTWCISVQSVPLSLSGTTIIYVPGEFCLWYLPNAAMRCLTSLK